MDLNIPALTNAIVDTNQENNQILLNAIRNKFAAQTATEVAAFSPPKFNIPLLKTPGNNSLDSSPSNRTNNSSPACNTPPTNQLNQFLLKQLQEKHANTNGIKQQPTGFVLPQLQTSSSANKGALQFELPALKTQSSSVSSLTSAINKLKVEENKAEAKISITSTTTPAIDLTTALASKLQLHQGTPPTRDFVKPPKQQINDEQDFDIPFIDCDRLDKCQTNALLLPISNEYCITDISKLLLKHSFVEPSPIGHFLCLTEKDKDVNKYLAPLPLKCLSREYREQKVKHFIEPFRFETKSPDDLVLEALSKYQRRHYN